MFFPLKLGFDKAAAGRYTKPKAKKFNYSSEANAAIIERALADAAELRDCTVSSVIEETLVEAFIPSDPHASYYASKVLFGTVIDLDGKARKYGIREALEDVFAEESAGISFKARHDNNFELVSFAKGILRENRAVVDKSLRNNHNPGENPLPHMLNCWDSVCSMLEAEVQKRQAKNLLASDYGVAAESARRFEHAMKEDPGFQLFNALGLLLENWDVLGNYTYTFRFLSSAIACSTDWNDSPAERIRFANVCQSVMSEWTAIDKARKEKREEARQESVLVAYDMADGAVIKVPSNWLVANPEDALLSHHAAVIEVKNGEKYNAPHILFYVSSPVDGNFTNEQRAQALAAANSVWPDLAQVQADRVQLKYGPDGGILNMEEYARAPQIGVFRIFDKGDYPTGRPPYGACIERAGKED